MPQPVQHTKQQSKTIGKAKWRELNEKKTIHKKAEGGG